MGTTRPAKRPFVVSAGEQTIEDCIPLESFDTILKEMKAFDEEREQVGDFQMSTLRAVKTLKISFMY
jgi:hypothetical protein